MLSGWHSGKRQAREDVKGGATYLKDMTINTILLCFTNNTFREVLDLTDPIDIWEKLES